MKLHRAGVTFRSSSFSPFVFLIYNSLLAKHMTKENLEQIRELFVAEREHSKKLLDSNNRTLGRYLRLN